MIRLGHRNMFHVYTNWITKSAAMTFHDSGINTLVRNWIGEAPSI